LGRFGGGGGGVRGGVVGMVGCIKAQVFGVIVGVWGLRAVGLCFLKPFENTRTDPLPFLLVFPVKGWGQLGDLIRHGR